MELVQVALNNLNIVTSSELDGYGYQSVSDAISCFKHFSKGRIYENCLEWCSGPGYLGFAAANVGLVNNITLLDIYKDNELVCNKTIENNNITNAKFILSDNFKNVETTETFDLIIGNPPHFNVNYIAPTATGNDKHGARKFRDEHWNIHKDFFKNVSNFLSDDGEIMLMENSTGSSINTFKDMISDNNLKIKDYCKSTEYPNQIWYLHITKM